MSRSTAEQASKTSLRRAYSQRPAHNTHSLFILRRSRQGGRRASRILPLLCRTRAIWWYVGVRCSGIAFWPTIVYLTDEAPQQRKAPLSIIESLDTINYSSRVLGGMALNNLDKAGNYPGTGNGIVLISLERRILDGKPGVSGRGTSPGSVVPRTKKGIKLLSTQSQRNQESE